MALRPLLPLIVLFLGPYIPLITAQSVGSFFTAIYLNGALVSSSETSCSDMGQPGYCCAAGQECAWDDGGKVACCPSGGTCEGSPYEGQSPAAGTYYTTYQQQQQPPTQTTTVYPQETSSTTECGCEETTATTSYIPVPAPIPATPQTTTVYPPQTTTSYIEPTTTTVQPAEVAVVTNANCPGGYSTIVEAHVGAPSRTVGCYVILNGAGPPLSGRISGLSGRFGAMGVMAVAVMWLW